MGVKIKHLVTHHSTFGTGCSVHNFCTFSGDSIRVLVKRGLMAGIQ